MKLIKLKTKYFLRKLYIKFILFKNNLGKNRKIFYDFSEDSLSVEDTDDLLLIQPEKNETIIRLFYENDFENLLN